jgi:hypothetical protein
VKTAGKDWSMLIIENYTMTMKWRTAI